jgi:trigger factor
MKVNVADAGPLRKKLTISYSRDEVQARRSQVLRQLSSEVKLNGFRPGKSSAAVVEKRYGEAATARAKEVLADEALNQAVRENQLKPIGPIQNEGITESEGLELVLSFEIKPAIQLPDPKSLGFAEEKVEVAEKDIDQAIESLCKRAGAMQPLAEGEAIAEDDSVRLEGKVAVDGAAVRELKDFHHLVGGYPLFGKQPKDVVEALAGKKSGDSITLDTVLPQTFTPAEHANKPAKLELTVSGAQRLRAATADDEFAKRMGFESLAKLREAMSTRLKTAREQEARQKQVSALIDKLIATIPVEPPPQLLDSALKQNVAAAAQRAEQEGKSGADLDKAKADAVETVSKGVKRFLIVDAIIESRRVGVTREDLEDQIRMAASQTGRKPDDIAKQLQTSGQINQVVQEIREAKAIEIFLDECLGKPAPVNPAHGEPGHVHGPDCNPGHGEIGHVHGPDCTH